QVGGTTVFDNQLQVNGNVGIGTSSPTATLDVRATSIKFASANDKAHTWFPYTNGEVYITGDADGSGDGSIHFRTFGSDTYSEKMVIKGDGKVGIGQSAPTEKLDVSGKIKADGVVLNIG
ncbi:hypothetical protein, partial [Xanthovirga aplysinae]|uniref:hypothetical protein n=1 Tax=Xanthovirga aplysinae TaxID=2529853 RepID=UPI003CCD4429